MKLFFLLLLVLQLFPLPGFAQGGRPEGPRLAIGYNEARFGGWEVRGKDLTVAFRPDYVAEVFGRMSAGGATIVRIFLFEGRQGFLLRETVPQTLGLAPDFLGNLEKVLALARARGLKIYLTLFDGNDIHQAAGPVRDYFYNILNDRYGELDAYENNVLRPLLALLARNQDAVYALDLMNEIEGTLQTNYFPGWWLGARQWIGKVAAFVKREAPWIRVTSAAGYGTAPFEIILGAFSGLGLDFYDVHLYSDSGTFSGGVWDMASLCTRAAMDGVPIIIGEFGQKTTVPDDALQSYVTQSYLAAASRLCFSAALAWRFDASEPVWNFVRADGSLRPAYAVMRAFGSFRR